MTATRPRRHTCPPLRPKAKRRVRVILELDTAATLRELRTLKHWHGAITPGTKAVEVTALPIGWKKA